MQQGPQYKTKMERYVTNIRRDARQKAIKQMRQKIYFETQPLQKIAQLLHVKFKQYEDYSIIQIMNQKFTQLVNVTKTLTTMKQQLLNTSNEQVNLNAHVQFWAYLLQQIYLDTIQINQSLQLFLSTFIKNNPYKILANFHLLQLKSLNTLQIVMISPKITCKLKNLALEWVQGTDGLILIQNSLSNSFLHPNQYSNVYGVIKEALEIGNLEKLQQSCTVIKQIMKNADYDQTFSIYQYQSDLMVGLLSCIINFVQDDKVQSVSSYADAVIYLMDSYEQLTFDYGRMGVALLATRMIISRKDQNMLKGLQMIKLLSEVEMGQSVTFLLSDRQLNDCGLWKTILGSQLILMSRNLAMKREAYNILANLMTNGTQQHIEILEEKVNLPDKNSLIEIVDFGLKNEEDTTILDVLIYYSRSYEQQNKGQQNKLLSKLTQFELEQQLKKLSSHQNKKISKNAQQLLKNIQYLKDMQQDENQ